jgi:DNA-binding CsgD family transcriptional regulator
MLTRVARDRGRVEREIALLADRALDTHTLRVEAMERLRREIPVDGFCFSIADPATLCLASVAMEGADRGLSAAYYRIEHGERDVAKHVELARGGRPARVLSQETRGEPERSPRYKEVLRPMGVRHELRAAARVDGATWGFLHLFRGDLRRDFDADDVALVERVSPILARALREAALRPCIEHLQPAEAPALLLLDAQHRVVEATQVARTRLDGLRDPGAPEQPVPEVLITLSTQAQVLHASGDHNGARATVPGTDRRWYRLDASCTDRDRVAIIAQPAGSQELLSLIFGMYGLSPGERHVTELVLRGLSTKQIAAALVVSPLTVQDRLKGVFNKVGVRSRRDLVARLTGAAR